MNIHQFEEELGYTFADSSLLEMALTHRSYAFEHGPNHCDNQRLEFLGDAILDFVIAEALYLAYPDYHEGELSRIRSRLVCESALCLLAKKLDFETHILMGKGEISASGMLRQGTLADAYEAVIGAVYLDGGFEAAKQYILRHHADLLRDPDGSWLPRDAKTRLQEIAQAKHIDFQYQIIQESGPSHAPTFEIAVLTGDKILGKGTGKSKKEAQQAAAENVLESMNEAMSN
ncbi:MAG: ribonuclease III [Proteobacteria bacterium]|nr:ribonuclease III [Pseudomonadota bacterium]